MKRIGRSLPALLFSLLLAVPATAAPLKVSEFGDLQTAIDMAQDGDTVIVDTDTSGAVLDKQLVIQGIPGRGGGLITGASLAMVSTGLLLDTGASGSELINLRIRATVAVASSTSLYGLYSDGPADDVAVRGCRFEVDAFGFYLINGGDPRSGWIVEHNTIELAGATQYFGGSYGVAIIGNWSDMRIAHNKITGTKPPGDQLGTGGVALTVVSNSEVVQNKIAVNVDPVVAGSWADGVWLRGSVTNVTVAMNDFRGCRTSRGPHAVTYEGVLVAESDLTGLGAFDHVPAPRKHLGAWTFCHSGQPEFGNEQPW